MILITVGINRQTNRMRLADSAILWKLFYNNISSSLIPIEHLTEILGPKAAQMKLWDLPLAHIPREPGQYLTRRSGWLHLPGGQSFCMEAVFNKGESGSGKAPSPCLFLLCFPPRLNQSREILSWLASSFLFMKQASQAWYFDEEWRIYAARGKEQACWSP